MTGILVANVGYLGRKCPVLIPDILTGIWLIELFELGDVTIAAAIDLTREPEPVGVDGSGEPLRGALNRFHTVTGTLRKVLLGRPSVSGIPIEMVRDFVADTLLGAGKPIVMQYGVS